MIKAIEDEQLRLSNENKEIANYAHSLKPKKAKPSEQKEKRGLGKGSNIQVDKKRPEVKKYKTYGEKHHGDCWHLKKRCFICHNVGHIRDKCPKKSNTLISSSFSKKKLCYTQKIIHHPILKT